MNLHDLTAWAIEMADRGRLRSVVRKDAKGQPRENDVTICYNFLVELKNRIALVTSHTQKAEKFMGDITEFLKNLETRGVIFPGNKPEPNPILLTPPGMGQSGPTPPLPPTPTGPVNPYEKKRNTEKKDT